MTNEKPVLSLTDQLEAGYLEHDLAWLEVASGHSIAASDLVKLNPDTVLKCWHLGVSCGLGGEDALGEFPDPDLVSLITIADLVSLITVEGMIEVEVLSVLFNICENLGFFLIF